MNTYTKLITRLQPSARRVLLQPHHQQQQQQQTVIAPLPVVRIIFYIIHENHRRIYNVLYLLVLDRFSQTRGKQQ